MTSWHGDDPTDRYPTQPSSPAHFVPAVVETRRSEGAALLSVVLLAFVLSVVVSLSTTYALSRTVDRLLSVPMCQEGK